MANMATRRLRSFQDIADNINEPSGSYRPQPYDTAAEEAAYNNFEIEEHFYMRGHAWPGNAYEQYFLFEKSKKLKQEWEASNGTKIWLTRPPLWLYPDRKLLTLPHRRGLDTQTPLARTKDAFGLDLPGLEFDLDSPLDETPLPRFEGVTRQARKTRAPQKDSVKPPTQDELLSDTFSGLEIEEEGGLPLHFDIEDGLGILQTDAPPPTRLQSHKRRLSEASRLTKPRNGIKSNSTDSFRLPPLSGITSQIFSSDAHLAVPLTDAELTFVEEWTLDLIDPEERVVTEELVREYVGAVDCPFDCGETFDSIVKAMQHLLFPKSLVIGWSKVAGKNGRPAVRSGLLGGWDTKSDADAFLKEFRKTPCENTTGITNCSFKDLVGIHDCPVTYPAKSYTGSDFLHGQRKMDMGIAADDDTTEVRSVAVRNVLSPFNKAEMECMWVHQLRGGLGYPCRCGVRWPSIYAVSAHIMLGHCRKKGEERLSRSALIELFSMSYCATKSGEQGRWHTKWGPVGWQLYPKERYMGKKSKKQGTDGSKPVATRRLSTKKKSKTNLRGYASDDGFVVDDTDDEEPAKARKKKIDLNEDDVEALPKKSKAKEGEKARTNDIAPGADIHFTTGIRGTLRFAKDFLAKHPDGNFLLVMNRFSSDTGRVNPMGYIDKTVNDFFRDAGMEPCPVIVVSWFDMPSSHTPLLLTTPTFEVFIPGIRGGEGTVSKSSWENETIVRYDSAVVTATILDLLESRPDPNHRNVLVFGDSWSGHPVLLPWTCAHLEFRLWAKVQRGDISSVCESDTKLAKKIDENLQSGRNAGAKWHGIFEDWHLLEFNSTYYASGVYDLLDVEDGTVKAYHTFGMKKQGDKKKRGGFRTKVEGRSEMGQAVAADFNDVVSLTLKEIGLRQ